MIEPFPDGCPPDDAVPVEGEFYRLADKVHDVGDQTGPSSWLRPYETHGSKFYKRPELVDAHGLSLFADADELDRARKISTWLGKKSVARVTITAADGHVRHSPIAGGSSHHDWFTSPFDLLPVAFVIEAALEVAA